MSIVYAQKNLTDDTADAFESFVEILLSGLDTVSFQLAGTWTGTVTFESTTDGDTYASLSVTPSTGAAAVTTATANGIWAADGCAGFYSVRARCSTFGSGVIIASAGAGANSVAAVANASDGQVLFMDGTQPTGDSGLAYDKTTNILAFIADGGASFAGAQSPIVMTGGTDPNGNTAIELTNAEGYNAFYSDDEIAISSDTSIEIFTGAGEGELSIIHGAVILQGAATSQLRAGLVDGIFQLAARDVDGAVWSAFATLTSANTPTFVVAPPAGGTVSIQATTYKSSDGSSGVTAGPFTTISSITVKNGIVTALTGS